MRSDLISSWLTYQWFQANAPGYISDWNLDVSDEVEAFVARIMRDFPGIEAAFASQSLIARTAIERWTLDNVALLGGGRPSPLTPSPSHVTYFTDANPEVLEEAAAAGYNTLQVDVRDRHSLQQISAADVAVGTGLFHFLPTEGVTSFLNDLAAVGVHQVVFNNAHPNAGEDLMSQWEKLGYKLHARTVEDTEAAMPEGWSLVHAESVSRFYDELGDVGEAFAQQADLNMMYMAAYNN